ncbi:MAG TPA: ribonuclease III [Aggregatilineales bacterium]|nr:ribonuclease III [Aggregatilineales bacterium]
MNIHQIQTSIEYHFADPALLEQALTHRSYLNEYGGVGGGADNERLEFLGDAVLDFLVGDMLFRRYPQMPEGDMTRLRAALVRTESLAELGADIQLGQALRMGRGEEASGGRTRITNVCAAFEALVGAMYLDGGINVVRDFISDRVDVMLEQVMAESRDKDARSLLQEWSQAEHNLTPAYRTISESGPDHRKEFVVAVLIGDKAVAHGTGKSKQAAAQSAAREALQLLEAGQLTI